MGKFSEFNVPLKTLKQGVHEFDYHLGIEFFRNMENDDIHGADLHVKLTVNCLRDRYDLNFTITGEVVLLCDRCLDDLHMPIEATYRTYVEYGKDYSETDDVLVIPESDDTLNVSYMIYDTVVLAIPMKHVHPMGKCNRQMSALLRKHRTRPADEDAELEEELIDEMEGMDDGGGNAPSDPRWDALKNFKADDE